MKNSTTIYNLKIHEVTVNNIFIVNLL